MRHALYNNHKENKTLGSGPIEGAKGSYFPNLLKGPRAKDKKPEEPVSGDPFLATRIKFLLDKYKADPETTNKILTETQMYEVNRTIAQDLKNADSEKQLTEEFIEFLNSI